MQNVEIRDTAMHIRTVSQVLSTLAASKAHRSNDSCFCVIIHTSKNLKKAVKTLLNTAVSGNLR
jgi:hypothetical protein